MSYWCIFADSAKNGTVTIPPVLMPTLQGDNWAKYNEDIRETVSQIAFGLTGQVPIEVHHLPYPAAPQLNKSDCPSFCFGKEKCWGRSSCPREYACCD
jgi:hypothetical protein